METFSALLALCAGNSPVIGEIPSQRPVAQSFDVSFDLRLNKRLSKQSWGWWYETPPRSLWPHCNRIVKFLSSNMGYYSLSIYQGYIWYDNAHSTITKIKLRSVLHPRTTPHTSPLRSSYGVSLVSYMRKMTAIYRQRTVICVVWRAFLGHYIRVHCNHRIIYFWVALNRAVMTSNTSCPFITQMWYLSLNCGCR